MVTYLSVIGIEFVVMYLCVRGIRRVSGHVFEFYRYQESEWSSI